MSAIGSNGSDLDTRIDRVIVRHHRRRHAIGRSLHQHLGANDAARAGLVSMTTAVPDDEVKATSLARMMVSTPEPAATGRMNFVSLSPCAVAVGAQRAVQLVASIADARQCWPTKTEIS